MNIYIEIEKSYLRKNTKIKLLDFIDKAFCLMILFWMMVALIFALFKSTITFGLTILFFIISLLMIFSLAILYVLLNSNDFLQKLDKKVSCFEKIKMCLINYFQKSSDISYLVDILKNNNISSKGELELIMSYFHDKQPVKVRSDGFTSWISLSISVAAFLLASYNVGEDVFYSYAVLILIIGFMFVMLVYIFKWLLSLCPSYNDEFYSEIVSDLTYIYINFDQYFSINKRGKNKFINRLNRLARKNKNFS